MSVPNPGVSLWLSPKPGSVIDETLQSTIDGLKSLFPQAPSFAPHITITSDIIVSSAQPQLHIDSILNRAVVAARSVPRLDVVIGQVKYGNRFFKKVYFQAMQTPELVSLAMVSREEFVLLPRQRSLLREKYTKGSEPTQEEEEHVKEEAARQASEWASREYDPHVSLVYSSTYTIDEALQQTVDTRLRDAFGDDYAIKGIGWNGGRLSLVRCEGPVEEWEVLGFRDI